jgi:dolichol-phosphate mannosyltransferase
MLMTTSELINQKEPGSESYSVFSDKPKLSLIVPTYNESENIAELVNRIEKSLEYVNFEIVIVDDSSPDGTDKIAETLNSKYGNVRVSRRSGKLGLGSAILHGFDQANANVLAVMDADMQHPPDILPNMYSKILAGNDLVIASRYIRGGGIKNWKVGRIIYSRVAIMLAHIFLPNSRHVEDVMSGCFMIRRNILKDTNLDPIGFKILLEILVRCKINRVIEVPYTFTDRRNGKSNLNPKEMINYIIHLYRILRRPRLRNLN